MMLEHDYDKYPELTNNQLNDLRFTSPHPQIEEDFDAVVVKVHDGDSITLRTSFRDFDFPLRLLDIDAPELNKGGVEAREWLKGLLLNHHVKVLINKSMRVGKYGRLLGKVLFNGLDVGQEELHLGLAKPFEAKEEGGIPDIKKYFRQNKIWS